MDELFGSPFGEDLSGWALPNGFRPHEETIELIRGISGSGSLTQQEVFLLAEYLNNCRDARHAWPGGQLFRQLHEMFGAGEVTEADFGYLGRVLEELDVQNSRVAEPPPAEDLLPDSAVRIEDMELPRIERSMVIAAEGTRRGFDTDLARHTCSCPGWYGNRRSFEEGQIERCCAHLAAAFVEVFNEEEPPAAPRILIDLMAERLRRGRGIDPKSRWKLLKIRMRPHLVSLKRGTPSSVYVYDAGRVLRRHVYHPVAKQWSFGSAPVNHRTLAAFVDRSVGSATMA